MLVRIFTVLAPHYFAYWLAGSPFDDGRHTGAIQMIAHVHDDRPKLITARSDISTDYSLSQVEKLMAGCRSIVREQRPKWPRFSPRSRR